MRFVVLLALIAGVAWVLVRAGRDRRDAWLSRLALVGTWEGARDGRRWVLELSGASDRGRYRETQRARGDGGTERVEEGDWRLVEDRLIFTPDGGEPETCEFRFFEPGRIGVHGPRRDRRIYERRADNLVRLPRARGR